MSEEEKQIMNKMIYCNLINGEQALKFNRHIKQIQEENELLHSIIKEVREYIKNNSYKTEWGDLEQDNEDININEDLSEKEFIEGLIEILYKER